ncbi:MAG: hypothetical protein UHD09_09330, partial [Bifidobacterium sp.]|nr:hypothetical protein [Bifidobacterium sp.]
MARTEGQPQMNPNPNPQGAPDTPPTQGTQQPYQQAQGAPTEQFARTAAQTAQQPKRMGLADALGSQHVKVGKYKVDYAALVTVVGAILAVIAIFLPFMSARIGSQQVGTVISGSQNMIQGSTAPLGWFLLCSFVVIAVLAVCRQEAAALTATVYSSLLSVFFVSLVARTYGSAASLMNAMGAGVQTRVNYGAGMWVLIIGIILMLIGTIVAYYNEFRANHPQAPTDDPSDAPAAPGPGYPTSDDQYQDNGWQFGTPDAQPTTSADSSDWQFGVPNAATAAVDDRGPAAPQA